MRVQNKYRIMLLTLFMSLINSSYSAIYNAPCNIDVDCYNIYNPEYRCYSGHCRRKNFEFNTRECLGMILIVIISMVANAGGLGAGAVIIPVYMFVYGFVATDSIPLSKVTIFAGALINLFFIWKKRHIFVKDKFLIEYELASVMIPLLLAGTMVGVLLSKFLPSFFITLALMVYLGLSILKLYKKGRKTHEQEKNQQKLINNQSR